MAVPGVLHQKIWDLRNIVKAEYRWLIGLLWGSTAAALLMFVVFVVLFYRWVFRPLRVLIKGSRIVAGGDFNFRIALDTEDEMAELAAAMNGMTDRFRTIRDGLDHQVQVRTKQVVRSERLASVGFLAAIGQALARVLWPFGRKPAKAKPEENPLEADVELDDPGIKKVLPYPIED